MLKCELVIKVTIFCEFGHCVVIWFLVFLFVSSDGCQLFALVLAEGASTQIEPNTGTPFWLFLDAVASLAPTPVSWYDTLSDHLESLSTSVIEILTADRLNGQCSGLYG